MNEIGVIGKTERIEKIGKSGKARKKGDSLDTYDRIFLLSFDEVVKYMGDPKQGMAQKEPFYLDDLFNSIRKAVSLDNTPTRWTLRTVGNLPYLVATVTIGGRVCVSEDFVNRPTTELFRVGLLAGYVGWEN